MAETKSTDASDQTAHHTSATSRLIAAFLSREHGEASVEWVMVAAGATAMGLLLLLEGQEGLSEFSATVREDAEGGRFQTDWVEFLPLNQN